MPDCSSRWAKNAPQAIDPDGTLSRVTGGFQQTAHWGAFSVRQDTAGIVVEPHPDDPAPSPLLANFSAALGPSRVESPAIRAGWLTHGPGYDGERRGADEFVQVSWDEAIELLSRELRRVYDQLGPEAVYGGSYGWASAGRFHHAQSQVHRFLNLCGGYVGARNTYSTGASTVILPHVLGIGAEAWQAATTRQVILDHTRLVLAFGGLPLKNSQIAAGGLSRHETPGFVQAMRDRGIEVVLVSPIRDDAPDGLGGQWLPVRPGTDVAVMLSIAHTLISEGLYDAEFVRRYTVGFERFREYVLGETDGVPKDPDWAEQISDVPSSVIAELARRAARTRTLVTCTFSLQRAKHGEQPVWMAVVLAALLGQIGLPGGGFGHGYACFGNIGSRLLPVPPPGLPRAPNPVSAYIPVARIADMLLAPGAEFEYDGQVLAYPRIELVCWCGGNPFHHHQDLGRLRRALARPATVVVHDPFWTAMAKHADIVIPSTTTLERNDIFATHSDPRLSAMQQVVDPIGDARNDYETFCLLSDALGFGSEFSEGRSEMEWLRELYERCRMAWDERGHELPPFERFWELGQVELPHSDEPVVQFEEFRHDPIANPLATPSGRIEIFSETIASFGYDDCPGHPAWLESDVTRSRSSHAGPALVLVANNPATRLHSQLDGGKASQASKVHGREPVRISRVDAADRGIETGDVVRLHNERGSCLAGAVVSDDVRPGVLQLSTGSWFDPAEIGEEPPFCVHGNPNVLTTDEGTSRLAQGCTGQLAVVQLERFEGELPAIRAFSPPALQHDQGERMTATTSDRPAFHPGVRRSPYFEETERAGAREYLIYNHMYMPADYGHADGEDYAALTTAVALWDVGAERQVELSGPDALRFADYLVTSDLSGFTAGRCKYTFCCDERGLVICDPVLLAVDDNTIWLSHGNIDLLLWAKGIAMHTSFDVKVMEPDVAPMQVQGPKSQELMAQLFGPSIEELPYYRCTRTQIDGSDVVVSRTGWSGGLGYEIFPLYVDRALDIWHLVVETGAPLGLVLAGPNVQRAMECGITDTSYYANLDANALEMGRPRAVDLDKGPFIGREALREIAERGSTRTTVGLIGSTERLPRAQDVWRVLLDGREVGQLRWSTFSPALQRAIAIAVLDRSAADEGTEVVVVRPDGETPMTVTALPFVHNT